MLVWSGDLGETSSAIVWLLTAGGEVTTCTPASQAAAAYSLVGANVLLNLSAAVALIQGGFNEWNHHVHVSIVNVEDIL